MLAQAHQQVRKVLKILNEKFLYHDIYELRNSKCNGNATVDK